MKNMQAMRAGNSTRASIHRNVEVHVQQRNRRYELHQRRNLRIQPVVMQLPDRIAIKQVVCFIPCRRSNPPDVHQLQGKHAKQPAYTY
jgi:hypothetical protein